MRFTLTECNRSRLESLKFSFSHPAVIRRPHSDSAPGELCPPLSPSLRPCAEGSSGSNGWVKRERTKSREPLLRTILCCSSHLQHKRERRDMERKLMNTDKAQWKDPELTTLISEVGGGTNIQSKQAHLLQFTPNTKSKNWFYPQQCLLWQGMTFLEWGRGRLSWKNVVNLHSDTWIFVLRLSGQWRTQKIFMGRGVSFSAIWGSFIFGVRCFWRHKLTSYSCFRQLMSYSCFQTNVLAKFVDTIYLFFDTARAIPISAPS